MLKNTLIKFKNKIKLKNKKSYDQIRSSIFPLYIKIRNKNVSKFKSKYIKEIEFENIKYKLVLNSDNGFVDQEIFWKGVYEEEVMSVLKEQIDLLLNKDKIDGKEVVFLDIGCNIGQELIFATAIDQNRVKAIGFEPLSYLCRQIEESIKINNFKNAKVYNLALGDQDKELLINIPEINIGGSSIVRDESNTEGGIRRETIIVRNAGQFILENKIENIKIIKIDVEGYEYEVLSGLHEGGILNRDRPIIILEYSPFFYKGMYFDRGEKILTLIKDLNYEMNIIDGSLDADQANILLTSKI